jgi:hypothetical protein
MLQCASPSVAQNVVARICISPTCVPLQVCPDTKIQHRSAEERRSWNPAKNNDEFRRYWQLDSTQVNERNHEQRH